MKSWIPEAQALQGALTEWRHHIHENPEVGMELPKTVAFVTEKLKEIGLDPQPCGGGVVATVGGKQPGKCFMLRGDMDALPLEEQTDEPFKSQVPGAMHACGHDMHTVMLLGAAKLLKEHEDEIKGTVKLMFQPGEEVLKGAAAMIEDGVLENPKVDAAAMFHVAAGIPAPAGVIAVPGKGPFTAASDRFTITIQGKGGHGAMPQTAVDPLNVMSHIYIALQTIVSREIAPADNAVLTVGIMQGGTANNIIPDTATMQGTIRTYDQKVRELIFERLRAIAEGTAASFRATADVEIIEGCPSVVVDAGVSGPLKKGLSEVFGQMFVIDPAIMGSGKLSGSEDFSFVTQKVPSIMMVLTAGDATEGYVHPQHHPMVRFTDDVLWEGAAAYAISAMSWLNAQ